MKHLALIIMSLFSLGGSLNAQQATDGADKKILVAYFSCTGTTEKVANAIAEAVNGKLYRITPATPILRQTLTGTTRRTVVRWKWQTRNHALHWVAKPSI